MAAPPLKAQAHTAHTSPVKGAHCKTQSRPSVAAQVAAQRQHEGAARAHAGVKYGVSPAVLHAGAAGAGTGTDVSAGTTGSANPTHAAPGASAHMTQPHAPTAPTHPARPHMQAAQPAPSRKGLPAVAAAVALVAVLALGGTLYAQANTAAQTDAAAANAAAPTAITQQRVTDSTTQTASDQATLAAFNAQGVTSNTSTTATPSATDAAGSAATAASDTFVTSITPQLTALLSAYGAGVACVIQPLDSTQPAFSYNASAQFASSGLTALAVQAAYIDAVTCGNLDPTDTYTVRAADIVGGTGTLKQRGAGATLTYAQLAQLMVAENDNTATNILIDTLGLPAVNAACQAAGAAQTSVNRKLMQLDTGAENYTTAANTATLLCAVGNKTAGSAGVCQAALDAMAAQSDNKALAAGVSTGSGAALAHKTATMGGLRHDAGILYVAQNAQNAEGVTSASATSANSTGTEAASSASATGATADATSDTFDNTTSTTTQTRAYAVVVLCNIGQTTANNLMKEIATLLTA